MFDEDLPRKTQNTPIDLEPLSIEELTDRIASLKEEITRCEAAILSKKAIKNAAMALFSNQEGNK